MTHPLQLVTVRFPIEATLDRKFVVEARLETNRSVVVALEARSVVTEVEPIVDEAVMKFVARRFVEVAEVVVP